MKNAIKFLTLCIASSVIFVSCSSDDDTPAVILEEEVITTMIVTLESTSETVTLQVIDEDGDGPADPEVTVSGDLSANTTYQGSILLRNDTEETPEIINEEIEEEADAHQFFFEAGTGLNITTAYTDTEADYITGGTSNPVGLTFTLTTTDASTGSFTVTLRHEPKKPNDGTLTDAGGSTDIAQAFSVAIAN